MARPKKENEPDWPAIYADWVTGTMSNVALSRKYGVSSASIGRRVKVDQWTTTHGPVANPAPIEPPEPTTRTARVDKPDVSKSMTPEQLRKRAKNLAQRLLAEVEDATTYEGEISDALLAEESDVVQRRVIRKALSSGERIRNLKEITAIIDAVDPKRKSKVTDKADEKPEGKKAQRQEAAEKAATTGPFAVPAPPRLVVSQG